MPKILNIIAEFGCTQLEFPKNAPYFSLKSFFRREWQMYEGRIVFSQLMDFMPRRQFRKCVGRYNGDFRARSFTCRDQFLCMAFAQLTYRRSLRDTVLCLRTMRTKTYHAGIKGKVSLSTLADANEKRDWRIYRDFAMTLVAKARELYAKEDFGLQLKETAFALDSSTIDLCLSVFPWARFRKTKSGVKLHTLLDLRGNIPSFVSVTDAKVHDVNILDKLIIEPGAIYIMDRAYLDFPRLWEMNIRLAYFVIRAKTNTKLRRLYSAPVDKTTGILCDQTVVLTGDATSESYSEKLRRIKYLDPETGKRFVFLTNNFVLEPRTVADLYKCRWQVELFFKWIKQHLRIKSFFGTSENAVKTQIWIAISAYLLVAIVKKRLKLELGLYTMLQVISISLFEKISICQVFTESDMRIEKVSAGFVQLGLFE